MRFFRRPFASHRLLLAALILLILAVASDCREEQGEPAPPATRTIQQSASAGQTNGSQPTVAPTATQTPLPTRTPTPALTPTITPTPTPTAAPVKLNGDPLAGAIHDATPQAGAPCGVVDLLDFPLDPPDALNITRGGQDFGVFRDRYDGYHTGEDWWGPGGRGGSFGEPVYSIGHGQVTFAHPYGWGIDQGTIIIRHVYADGRTFYSFYGHLDPPSVQLKYGECVKRGQKIGEIGRPRSSPHLHFEIRTHTPMDPGPGYWSVDPTRSGWLRPSETIWNQRMGVSPGVTWLRPYPEQDVQGAGLLQGTTLVAVTATDLVGLNIADGTVRWQLTVAEQDDESDFDGRISPFGDVLLDTQAQILYAADRRGRISAIRLPPEAEEQLSGSAPVLLWDLQLHDVRGTPALIPLPSGGVVLVVQRRMIALSPAGAILWREPFDAQPVDWLSLSGSVLVSATGGEGTALWELSAEGRQRWQVTTAGRLVESAGQPFLYDGRAVYRLDAASKGATRFFDLPDGLASQGDIIALPDGGLLLAHMGGDGRRLLALSPDGSLRWQRAYGQFVDGVPTLVRSGPEFYLLSEEGNGSWSRLFLHHVDLAQEELTLLFTGGTRTPIRGDSWLYTGDAGLFLINIGGGTLVALDGSAAFRVACDGTPANVC